MLKTTVKASGVTNLTDARYFAAWHVDWLGFDLSAEGLTNLPLPAVKEIKDWIEGPKIIGELAVLDIEASQQLIDYLALEYIQVDMYPPVELLNSLNISAIIKKVVIEPTTTYDFLKNHLDQYFEYVDYFLIDFEKNGIEWEAISKNTKFDHSDLKTLCEQYDIFLKINFNKKNTLEILANLSPYGISVTGGMEEKVGYKSFDELDDLFEMLEE